MKINLEPIYSGLKKWRDERRITVESRKEKYLVNVMEKFGELAWCLNGLKSENDGARKIAERGIISALCDIVFFTINAWDDQKPGEKEKEKPKEISTDTASFDFLLANCAEFNSAYRVKDFENVLIACATLCDLHGFNFEVAMNETIKDASSRTGYYDEKDKQWILDESNEARAKWHTANYELARIKDE